MLEGRVKDVVKGGLMWTSVWAFLPSSQIDIIPPKDLETSAANAGVQDCEAQSERQNIVLSRFELIEEERAKKRGNPRDHGARHVIKGKVKNITDFGAFIDLDGSTACRTSRT